VCDPVTGKDAVVGFIWWCMFYYCTIVSTHGILISAADALRWCLLLGVLMMGSLWAATIFDPLRTNYSGRERTPDRNLRATIQVWVTALMLLIGWMFVSNAYEFVIAALMFYPPLIVAGVIFLDAFHQLYNGRQVRE